MSERPAPAPDERPRPGTGAGEPGAAPPLLGVDEVDAALAALADLDSHDVGDHHARLQRAQQALQEELQRGSEAD